jgi:hypothetical protein
MEQVMKWPLLISSADSKYRSSDLERDCIDFFDVDETIFAAHALSNDDSIIYF